MTRSCTDARKAIASETLAALQTGDVWSEDRIRKRAAKSLTITPEILGFRIPKFHRLRSISAA